MWSFLNSKGEVRLESVRNPEDRALDLSNPEDQVKLVRLYREWVTDDNHILLESENEDGRILHAIKAVKRGNDMAVSQIGDRLRDLETNLQAFAGFPMTGLLFLTLTYDQEHYPGGIEDAWRAAGKDFNRFMAAVRKWAHDSTCGVHKKHGTCRGAKVYAHRSWEAHKSGWPHIHTILAFSSVGFYTERRAKKGGGYAYRTGDETNRKMQQLWGHGHVDTQAIPSGKVKQRLKDILWYVTKDSQESDYREIEAWKWKKLLGLAIGWYVGKRLWSASKLLTLPPARARAIPDDFYAPKGWTAERFLAHVEGNGWHPATCLACRQAEQPAHDLTRPVGLNQTNLAGETILEAHKPSKWTFVGMVRSAQAGIPPEEWHKLYPLGARRRLRRLADVEKGTPCGECGGRSVNVGHLEDADEDAFMCQAHASVFRDGYPDLVKVAWIPKRMRKHAGGNMAEAFA